MLYTTNQPSWLPSFALRVPNGQQDLRVACCHGYDGGSLDKPGSIDTGNMIYKRRWRSTKPSSLVIEPAKKKPAKAADLQKVNITTIFLPPSQCRCRPRDVAALTKQLCQLFCL